MLSVRSRGPGTGHTARSGSRTGDHQESRHKWRRQGVVLGGWSIRAFKGGRMGSAWPTLHSSGINLTGWLAYGSTVARSAYTTNMAMPATNIATVVTATTVHPKRELGWPCISFLSEATTRMATRRNGASNPLMTAVQ